MRREIAAICFLRTSVDARQRHDVDVFHLVAIEVEHMAQVSEEVYDQPSIFPLHGAAVIMPNIICICAAAAAVTGVYVNSAATINFAVVVVVFAIATVRVATRHPI